MKFLIMILLALPTFSFAHEGHDKAPGAVNAPHGGFIQGTNELYLELVANSEGIKIYPLTHGLKPIALKEIQLDGKVSFPKKSKAETVKFDSTEDAFVAKVNSKGAHRYTLELNIAYQGKKEKTKFNVEPQ